MRGATECAKRLKHFFNALRTKFGNVGRPAATDPITQLILGIFSRDALESKAREALERLRALVVDYNELRVIPPIELASSLDDYPEARLKCEDLSRALNRIFAIEHSVSLDRLRGMSRKDVQTYLDKVDGLEAYTRARVRLLGLEQHAIPLDEAMWALAQREQLVDAKCTLEEAQHFLERQIPEEDGLEFVTLLRKYAWAEMSAAVRKHEVTSIRSVPPDRTTRNMLQLLSSGGTLDDADAEVDPELELGEIEELALLDSEGAGAAARSGKTRPGSPKPKAGAAPRRATDAAKGKPARKGSPQERRRDAKSGERAKPARK